MSHVGNKSKQNPADCAGNCDHYRGPTLLLSSYVSLYCVNCWSAARFGCGGPAWVFAPIESYEQTDYPGSLELAALSLWCSYGGDLSLNDAYAFVSAIREIQSSEESVLIMMDPPRFAGGRINL